MVWRFVVEKERNLDCAVLAKRKTISCVSILIELLNRDDCQFGAVEVAATTAVVGIPDVKMSIMLDRARIRKTQAVSRFARLMPRPANHEQLAKDIFTARVSCKFAKDDRELTIRFAPENDWGYTRIMGELKKLGLTPPSRNTIKNILKENGPEPGPKRGEGTWDEFLKMHAATLWKCDFYAKRVLTLKGWRDLHFLIFLHAELQQVYVAPSTFHPNEERVTEQAEAFLKYAKSEGIEVQTPMRERDSKYQAPFDAAFKEAGTDAKVSAFRAPNTVISLETRSQIQLVSSLYRAQAKNLEFQSRQDLGCQNEHRSNIMADDKHPAFLPTPYRSLSFHFSLPSFATSIPQSH